MMKDQPIEFEKKRFMGCWRKGALVYLQCFMRKPDTHFFLHNSDGNRETEFLVKLFTLFGKLIYRYLVKKLAHIVWIKLYNWTLFK